MTKTKTFIVVEIRSGMLVSVFCTDSEAEVILRDMDAIENGALDPYDDDPNLFNGLTKVY
jgi:hypothetical protein